MSGFWTIYRRELSALFLMPLAWILLCVALPVNGALFSAAVQENGGFLNPSFEFLLGNSWVFWGFLAFLPPLLTMRMISEESRSGILEYLLTAPVSDAAVVGGKLAAAGTFMALFWSCILIYGALCQSLGSPPEWGPVIGGYLGTVLVSLLFCAVGLFASALTATPMLAAMIALAFNILILSMGLLGGLTSLPDDHWVQSMLLNLNVLDRFTGSFAIGVFDTGHAVFFLAITGLFTFLATRLVESKRWR